MARWYSASQWNYYRKLNARGFAIRVWVLHWGDGFSEEYLLHHLLHQLDQITYHGHYSDCFIDLLQLQGNFWAFCVFIILKRLSLPYYNVVAPNEAKSSINFNLLSKLINANFPSLNFFSKTSFQIYKDVKHRNRRQLSMSRTSATATQQARRKQEDNLAVVFMGIVLIFLVCNFPRNMLSLFESLWIRRSMACQKTGMHGFPVWAIILGNFR